MAKKSNRFESLDAMRGVAALFVAFVHFPAIFLGSDFAPLRHAYILTNLFFALSGFILLAAHGSRMNSWGSFTSFGKKRIARLIPLHILTSVVILGIPYLAYATNVGLTWLITGEYAGDLPNFRVNWEHFMIHVLLLQGTGLVNELVFNFPAWSMGMLFFCSLLLALINALVPKYRLWIFGALSLGAWVVIWQKAPNYMGATHDYGVFRAMCSYFFGALTYAAWKRWPLSKSCREWVMLYQCLALALLFWFATWVGVNNPRSLLAPLVFAVVMWFFAYDEGDFAGVLEHPLFNWLSERSYSIFMNQAAFLFIGLQAQDWITRLNLSAWDGKVVGTFAALLYLACLLTVSNFTYKHVELRFSVKKKPKPTNSSAAQPA